MYHLASSMLECSTHCSIFSKLNLWAKVGIWQYGTCSVADFISQVHSPLGTINANVEPEIFLHVTASLSDHPQEVDPVNNLHAEKLASIIGFPDFF